MPQLSIKIDDVAALRRTTRTRVPDPVHVAVMAEAAGADSITAHLRVDRALLKDRDIYLLKETVQTRLNLQIAPDPDLIKLALEVKPYRVTLMPMLLEGEMLSRGIDFTRAANRLHDAAVLLDDAGVSYSCLVNPDADSVKEAARLKCRAVQLAAYDYSSSDPVDYNSKAETIDQVAQTARKLGINVACGGGLDYLNIRALAALGSIDEYIVGHNILARALLVGIERAVRDMSKMLLACTKENPFV